MSITVPTITKRQKDSLIRRINKCKERIAHERDVLRDLLSEAEEIVTSADDAVDSMTYAADRLSELL